MASSNNAAALVGRIAREISSQTITLAPAPFGLSNGEDNKTTLTLPAASCDPVEVLARTANSIGQRGNSGPSNANQASQDFGKPISLLVNNNPKTLAKLVSSSSSAILGLPIVIHVATSNGDHAAVLQILRSNGYAMIYSASLEEAQKNTLLASRIAVSASRAVVHFFEPEESHGRDITAEIINIAPAFLAEGPKLNGHVNGMSNGHSQTTGDADTDNLPSRHHSLASAIEEAYTFASKHDLGLAQSHYAGPATPSKLILVLGSSTSVSSLAAALDTTDIGILSISLLRPLSQSDLLALIPTSVTSLLVLDQAYTKTTRWSPLYLDLLSAFHANQAEENSRSTPIITSATLAAVGTHTAKQAAAIVTAILSSSPAKTDSASVLGQLPTKLDQPEAALAVPKHELAYHKVLSQSFAERLNVLNDLKSPSPSLAIGKFLATAKQDGKASWIIGSDAWSYDQGLNGLQTLLSTGVDCNILIVDSTPYPVPKSAQRKKDIGLYALNYGNAYVASIAVYGDYSQTVRALLEAEKFKGPSVIMAYLPGGDDDTVQALDVLRDTKKAMESGYWGLYRFDPSKNEKVAFSLDSVKIKQDLQDFLDRQNLLTQLANKLPSYDIPATSLGKQAKQAAATKASEAYERLSGALASGPSLLVLCASDGGTADKLAKKFVARANTRGCNARLEVMDTFGGSNVASLKDQKEDNVVLVTSTAGQGEFPLNGRTFWKGIQTVKPAADNAPDGADGSWAELKFAVFGLGDSHYWPRPEDAGYYNKPAKDLDKKLADLAIPRLVEEIGLGDDQDADGYMTGYKVWEQKIWEALGVAGVEIIEAEPEPITNEHIKIASNYLRGTIAEGLVDKSTGALAESDGQLTKFHGIYQQFDRDIQEERLAEGLEPAYSFMVRVRMPAGVCTPKQWLAIDAISDRRGNSTFKLTTRQTFQFHGIIKANLKPAIQEINKALLDTIAACGDVNRNVMCSCNPSLGPVHAQIAEIAKNISEHLMPRTNAYAEIWLDKKLVAGDAVKDTEPLYGPYYLPRKFKIAIAVPPQNDTDAFCHDIGLIAIVGSDGNLEGFNVAVGGGMGVTHSMKKTYPRLGSIIGYATPDQIVDVCEKVMLVQRDNGDRTNRKHARLKYTVDDMTVEGFKNAVEERLKYKLAPQKPFKFEMNRDEFGWQTGYDGKKHFTCFIENGRVQDEPGKDFRTGLREIAKIHTGVFRLTANQHLIISDIETGEQEKKVTELLKKYKLDNIDYSGLRLSSSACVAFPTCGLAMAESERYLPVLIDKVEKICEENGLRNDSIVMRMSGCANGYSRPWAGEVNFVGKAPGSYLMNLGGSFDGQRLSKPYRPAVGEEEILAEMRTLIKRYATERLEGEHFGDFTVRAGIVKPTNEGKYFYDDSVLA